MEMLPAVIKIAKSKGFTIGFANGCFDLLHDGHKNLLTQARKHCQVLIVAINDDKSVARLKGYGRPIHNIDRRIRAIMDAQLADVVIGFHSDEDLLNLIKSIVPDVLIKSEEYQGCLESSVVRKSGGKIVYVPRTKGISSTEILAGK